MDIVSVPSPNFMSGRKGYRPEAIVIHIMEGTLAGTDSWFANSQSKVSAHYGIGVNGVIHRYVQESDTAWHAGRVHAPQWTLIKPAATAGMYLNPNYYTIGIEHEGKNDSEWSDAMYESSAALVADIALRWRIPIDRSHVIGHREIYSLKTCPGAVVSLDKIVEMAQQKAGVLPPGDFVASPGTAETKTSLNLRRNSPSTKSPVAKTVVKGTRLSYTGYTDSGEKVSGVSRWYRSDDGLWFWGGGVDAAASLNGKILEGKMATDCEGIKKCVRGVVREMWFAGTTLTDDQIGKKTMNELHLGFGASLPGVPPAAAFVLKLSGCTDVAINNLTQDKLKGEPDWSVDKVAAFICAETKLAKGEPL